jgi:histidinol-phosphate/aromatic aminotransferase/cobyric acid decarboxylase-like protein
VKLPQILSAHGAVNAWRALYSPARQISPVEDDYDSEFWYDGSPVEAIQGLDRAGRVIYIDTFSKVLFPSLRLGYMVVPESLVPALAALRSTRTCGTELKSWAKTPAFTWLSGCATSPPRVWMIWWRARLTGALGSTPFCRTT